MARFSLRRERLADPHSKRELNREIFDIAAARYDIITRVLSFGQDAAWKDRLIASLPARTSPVCVDLACGTGDLTRRLAVRFPDADVLGLDLNASMLALAGVRTVGVARIRYLQGDMGATGLDAESVDLVTGGYAIRNAGDLDEALQEIHRILKPGGIAAFLDFSKPAQPVWQQLELALLRFWGGLWGLLFHRSPGVYMYIAESLQRFPDRKQLAEKFRAHGFDVVSSKLHFCGIMQRVVLEKRGAGKERRVSARADLVEEMDRPDCPEDLLFRTLAQFAKVNRLFSRYRTLLKKHVLADMATDRTRVWRFVDLGAGGCDIDRWLVAQCRRLGVKVSVVAVERDARVRRFAQQANVGYPEIEVVAADVLTGDYLDGADYVFANHLLHHLTDAQCVALLHRIDQARPRVYVLSDILRSPAAYCGYAAIAPLLFRNSFVVADGLASICRSFTVPEAKALLAAAALVHPVVVKQLLPGRLVLVGGRGAAAG